MIFKSTKRINENIYLQRKATSALPLILVTLELDKKSKYVKIKEE